MGADYIVYRRGVKTPCASFVGSSAADLNTMSRLGEALTRMRADKAARDGRRVTQREVANALGVPDVYVSRWETGRNVPERYALAQLARFYDEDEAALLALREEAVEGNDGRRATSRGVAGDRRVDPLVLGAADADSEGLPPASEGPGLGIAAPSRA
jgi:transcriptional regulator with XRE-family HTH domain